ncbi:hypothetical protein LCGC14_1150670 [marine sediment metagenome]|uniref:DOD-type homing endonuclease domain-containing protein n=1 Tax=marine sediment metagenome TaxID=412755 RepID=A0A0F9PDQ5_9ZZZZ
MAEFESPDGFSEEEREYKWLPTMVDFHNSGAQSRALVGPVGSGKTPSGTFEVCMYLPHFLWEHYGIKKTRWVVIRNCYDPDTEVLTEESGWVKFRDLNEDAAIAIRKDGYLEYEVPKLHYRAPYKGEMVGIRQQGVDLLVTPDHHLWASTRRTRKKIWSEYECVKAQDIYGHDGLHRFCATADWRGKPINKSKDFFEFLGFWFAEGSASILPRKDCAGVHYRLNVTQKGDRAYVSGLLTRAGLTYGVSTTSGEVDHYRISTRSEEMKDLIHELSDYGKSLTKWIPDYVKQAPKEYIKAFLFGFQKGDGSFKTGPKDCDRLYTSSPQLADDLHELLVKAGKHAVIGCRLQFGKPQYTITIHTDKRESPEIRKSHWRKEQYDGEVFCVEVSTHVILVRRNGKAVWCGQSYPQLRDTTMRTVFEWFPQGKRHVQESRYVLRWPISDPGSRHEGSELEVEILFRACDRPDDIDNFNAVLNAIFQILRRGGKSDLDARRIAEDAAREVSRSNLTQIRGQMRSVLGVDVFFGEPRLQALLEDFAAANAKRITSIPEQYLDDVEGIVHRGLRSGRRAADIAEEFIQRFGIAKSKAEFIARNELSSLNADLTRDRQQALGIEEYIWRTSRDERVRPSHARLEGSKHSWDDPPETGGGRHNHPGQDFNCRCTAEPVIPGVEIPVTTPSDVLRRPPRRPRVRRRPAPRVRPAPTEADRTVSLPRTGKTVVLTDPQVKRRGDAAELQGSEPARARASSTRRTSSLLWNWVHGSKRKTSIMLKAGAIRAFGLRGIAYNPRGFAVLKTDIARTAKDLRRLHSKTQAEFARRGIKTVKVFRGVKGEVAERGAVESWSTSRKIAQGFAGPRGKVLAEEIPVERVLAMNNGPEWVDGVHGDQDEMLILF